MNNKASAPGIKKFAVLVILLILITLVIAGLNYKSFNSNSSTFNEDDPTPTNIIKQVNLEEINVSHTAEKKTVKMVLNHTVQDGENWKEVSENYALSYNVPFETKVNQISDGEFNVEGEGYNLNIRVQNPMKVMFYTKPIDTKFTEIDLPYRSERIIKLPNIENEDPNANRIRYYEYVQEVEGPNGCEGKGCPKHHRFYYTESIEIDDSWPEYYRFFPTCTYEGEIAIEKCDAIMESLKFE